MITPYENRRIVHIPNVDHPESLSVGPRGEVYTTGTGEPEATYQVQSGVITIQQSDRYVLVGRYQMTVAHPDGHILKLTGVFNSGCTGTTC